MDEQRQRSSIESFSGRKCSAQDLLKETGNKKIVLLGDPGSGKTTLMSYWTVMLAQQQLQKKQLSKDTELLPILIRIRNFSLKIESSILEFINQFSRKNLGLEELPAGFCEYWLENGKTLILLDGLDEVADANKRYEVVKRIESFLEQFPKNRVIITSRPAGYRRDFFRTENFPHYQIQSFDDAKIDQFINHWYDSRILDPIESKRRQDSLKKAISDNERIKLIARNPLLLTIIALIHRYEAFLPRERYKLYEKAVDTLLTSWDANKEFSHRREIMTNWN